MAWNPYTDQKNRAYQGILTSLFPEQTKTFPRIIVWSLIFLADLILGIGGATYFGLLRFDEFQSQNQMMLTSGLQNNPPGPQSPRRPEWIKSESFLPLLHASKKTA